MSQFDMLRRLKGLMVAVLLAGIAQLVQAAAPATLPAAKMLTECLGYYTINLPGEFEYALMNDFSEGLSAWGSEIRLGLAGMEPQDLYMSKSAVLEDLRALMALQNERQQKEIEEVKSNLAETDRPSLKRIYAERLSELHLFEPISSRAGISRIEKDKLALSALVNGHILSTDVKPQGTPEQTLDAFLSHYKPRALGEVPTGPGVCVPYGFFTGEEQPATVGLNIRLKDQPDIVIFLLATDAASDPPDDPHKLWDGLEPAATFFGSRRVTPVHAIKPLRPIVIDGHEGLGSFVRITRRTVADQRTAFNNAAENDEDWGYFAYVPGMRGGKPGDSFNLKFKVERFGRFAKHPMSEDEFRDLVVRIASSIKRRHGAWVQN